MELEQIKALFEEGNVEKAYGDGVDVYISWRADFQALEERRNAMIASGEAETPAFQEIEAQLRAAKASGVELLKVMVKSSIAVAMSNLDLENCKEYVDNEVIATALQALRPLMSVDEFFKADAEFIGYVEKCKESLIRATLLRGVNVDTAVTCAKIKMATITKVKTTINFHWIDSEYFKDLLLKSVEGLQADTLEEFKEEHQLEPEFVYENFTFAMERFIAAKNHFEKVKKYYQNNREQSDNKQGGALVTKLLNEFSAAKLLLECEINEDLPTNVLEDHLKLRAEICLFELGATIETSQSVLSMLQAESRTEYITELSTLHQEILKVNPGYELPPIPALVKEFKTSAPQPEQAASAAPQAAQTAQPQAPQRNIGKLVRGIISLVFGGWALLFALIGVSAYEAYGAIFFGLVLSIPGLILSFTSLGGKKGISLPALWANIIALVLSFIAATGL